MPDTFLSPRAVLSRLGFGLEEAFLFTSALAVVNCLDRVLIEPGKQELNRRLVQETTELTEAVERVLERLGMSSLSPLARATTLLKDVLKENEVSFFRERKLDFEEQLTILLFPESYEEKLERLRVDVINSLTALIPGHRYLEVGGEDSTEFHRVSLTEKVRVSVKEVAALPNGTLRFDFIYLHRLPTFSEVAAVWEKTAPLLADQGLMMMDGCNPKLEMQQIPGGLERGSYGEMWKLLAFLRGVTELDSAVIDVGRGFGVMKLRNNSFRLNASIPLRWESLVGARRRNLRLLPLHSIQRWIVSGR